MGIEPIYKNRRPVWTLEQMLIEAEDVAGMNGADESGSGL